jgi:hypothetical protein
MIQLDHDGDVDMVDIRPSQHDKTLEFGNPDLVAPQAQGGDRNFDSLIFGPDVSWL